MRRRATGARSRTARGRQAENWACDWLREQGYEIRERNVRTRAGEIDIVAIDRGTLCFVEVKARWSDRHGPAILAVDERKRRRLSRAVALYLLSSNWPAAMRFDVLGLDRTAGGWNPTLIRDAFEVSDPFLV